MKKAILTIGLFSMVMILTSFTTPETGGKGNTGNPTVSTGGDTGTLPAPGKKLDFETGGTSPASGKKLDFETGGTSPAAGKKFD